MSKWSRTAISPRTSSIRRQVRCSRSKCLVSAGWLSAKWSLTTVRSSSVRARSSSLECAYSAITPNSSFRQLPQPKSVLPRLATELGTPDKIQHRALELAALAEDAGITIGGHLHGFAAGYLYRAGQKRGWMATQQELAAVSNTSPTTIRSHRDALLEVLEVQER
ncbi:hypothetical protein [Halopiger xanaduensis]|uniref:hypothetical protein n=1 Tax=Halopiger xanaduensis TaxID=387343 RepID=UPI0009FF67E2|nr:hypothetical protein [Halopiger xanaduensis]